MICILKRDLNTQEVVGFIIAIDCADAKNQAYSAGDHALADVLYRMEGPLENCLARQQELWISGARYTMLNG